MNEQELLAAVLDQYLGSRDFNGLPGYSIARQHHLDLQTLRDLIGPLVASGQLVILFGDVHPNPHIRAFKDEPAADQLTKLAAAKDDHFVLYPTPGTLARRVDPRLYGGRPFTLRLALGQGQLEYASFELPVLDTYRRDPRYRFSCNDIQGQLSVSDEAYDSTVFPERHKVFLQSFGFSYTPTFERAVAVFLIDLSRLTPEHQQIWAAHEVGGDYRLHPDFFRAQVLGDWEVKASLTDAFVEELRTINEMTRLIGWPPLFRDTYGNKPKDFGFLLRCTRRDLNDFILLLDKMLSDNLNMAFFPSRIDRTTETVRKDGKITVQQRGSISLLDEWLRTTLRTPDPAPIDELVATFRDVRKRRQEPAHSVNDDAHDPGLFKEQRDILLAAYDALRTLRLILANHPKARPAQDGMNENVRRGAIWQF